ncbi:redoxin domain-containing protein [Lysobacter sp. F60174L2]|uniref:redoxin domain-containing protein n=1 Tax=Lysobacter sp. F60174L2 TaxID=3459295 RepID=UPI00403DA228
MLLLLLAYLGGVLTILSPCILPVLPFVFARSDKPFLRAGLPMLVGMAVTFAAVATLAAVGSQWVVQANQVGRWLALALMAAFAIALLWPALASRVGAPFQALGGRLSRSADSADERGRGGIGTSLLLGVATGLLWAPCAGPILGLVLTGAALQGASTGTTALLLAYALGAATSLAIALLVGGRVFAALKGSLGMGEWVRRGLGVLVLAAVAAIALGLDTGLLTRLSTVSTARVEQSLLDRIQPPAMSGSNAMMEGATDAPAMMMMGTDAAGTPVHTEGNLPSLAGATGWLNSEPLDPASLRGKVVLIDFWTYSCINCLRALPHVREWADKYRDQGLVVIGVHAPEFAFERDPDNVRRAVSDLRVTYPVAIDNDYAIWRAFNNRYWPAHYFIDAQGRIRAHHFGEGNYAESEGIIRGLLQEAGRARLPAMAASGTEASGVEQPADRDNLRSPETYVGYARAENFASAGGLVHDREHRYAGTPPLTLNQWALSGDWTVGREDARLEQAGGGIRFRFHARDLHLVLAPGAEPVRFRVRIDGRAPGDAHGVDTDASGSGVIDEHRLYQLVRQRGDVAEHTFEIEFLDPGVRAYAFTFG